MAVILLKHNVPDGEFCTTCEDVTIDAETFKNYNHCPFRGATRAVAPSLEEIKKTHLTCYCSMFRVNVLDMSSEEYHKAGEPLPKKCPACLAATIK